MNVVLLDLIREEVPREIERRVPTVDARATERGRCIQSTRVGLEALRYFGVHGKPLVTLMLAGNAPWAEWMLDGSPPPMPDPAWAVGIDDRPAADRGFPGHLVIELDGHILDLDSGLYARPERGIHVPPTVLVEMRESVNESPLAVVPLDDDGVLVYGPHPDPPDYRKAGAWKHTQKWSGPVIRAVRARLGVT